VTKNAIFGRHQSDIDLCKAQELPPEGTKSDLQLSTTTTDPRQGVSSGKNFNGNAYAVVTPIRKWDRPLCQRRNSTTCSMSISLRCHGKQNKRSQSLIFCLRDLLANQLLHFYQMRALISLSSNRRSWEPSIDGVSCHFLLNKLIVCPGRGIHRDSEAEVHRRRGALPFLRLAMMETSPRWVFVTLPFRCRSDSEPNL
jgi:hypothetical protein